jgi:type I restriction enzyme S subunit
MDYVDGYLFEGLHLLVAEDGSVERPDGMPFVQLVNGQFWVNNHSHVLRAHTDEDTRFIYYALQTVPIRPFISGSVQAKLTLGNLNKIPIPYPTDQRERRAIAHILGTLDDKIELNRRMSETLEAMARALFKSWFVDFEPVRAKMEGRWRPGESLPGLPAHLYDLFPNRLVPSELGEIPEGWEVQPYTAMVDVIGGGTPKTSVSEYWDGDIPWFSVADAPANHQVWVMDTQRTISRAGLEASSAKILPVGTTVLSARGTVGRLALVGIPMAMNQSCYGLRGKIDRLGFFTYFATRQVVSLLQQRTHGSVFDTITRDTLATVDVIVPPAAFIEAFENCVLPIMGRLRHGLVESRTLAQLRDTLLPKLISGELRVKDAERFVARVRA